MVRCRVIKPHTCSSKPSHAQAICRAEPSQALFINTQRRVCCRRTRVVPCSTSNTPFISWPTILFALVSYGTDDAYFYIEARPNRAQAKPSKCVLRGQVHETSIPKIGTVPCNKALHLLVQAMPKRFAEPSRAKPSQAKPSLIYNTAKKIL